MVVVTPMKFDVIVYEKENGSIPFLEDISSFDKANKALVQALIDHVRQKGLLGMRTKIIRDGIYEMKKGQLRVLYFYYKGKVIVVTSAFLKKTQRTPRQEIRRAVVYMNDYMQNNLAKDRRKP